MSVNCKHWRSCGTRGRGCCAINVAEKPLSGWCEHVCTKREEISAGDRPQLPTPAQAATALTAVFSSARVPLKIIEQRSNQCQGCDQQKIDKSGQRWCGVCGCGTSTAAREVLNLAAYEEKLPKWGCKHPRRGDLQHPENPADRSRSGWGMRYTFASAAGEQKEIDAGEFVFSPSPSPPKKLGIVIGTFAALPYIHLQLEARRRFYPTMPMLVHDDCSRDVEKIMQLCHDHGVDFVAPDVHRADTIGDMSAFLSGMIWAQGRCEYLVKFSRRWIAASDWVSGFVQLAQASQGNTFSERCTHFNFGFRTEAMGLRLSAWQTQAEMIRKQVLKNSPIFVEGFVHNLARQNHACVGDVDYKEGDCNGYVRWPLLGTSRTSRRSDLVWHDSHSPADYFALSKKWGLPYTLGSFQDPNRCVS